MPLVPFEVQNFSIPVLDDLVLLDIRILHTVAPDLKNYFFDFYIL